MKKIKIHYAWIILISCCILQGTSIGILVNCIGIFYLPVSTDFGCSVSNITMYVTIKGIFTCLSAFFVKNLISRFPLKKVVTISVLVSAIPFLFMGISTTIWQWYICAIFQGLGCVVLNSYMAPIVLRNWFKERLGFAFGLVTASSGLIGVIMSALGGRIIATYSWRYAITLQGLVMLVLMLPCSMILLKMLPDEKGLKPYGWKQSDDKSPLVDIKTESNTQKQHLKIDLPVILFGLAIVFCGSLTSFGTHFAAMGKSFGILTFDASLLISIKLAGNSISKFLFGAMNDTHGSKKTSIFVVSIVLVATIALFVKNGVVLAFAAFFFGFIAMVNATEFPLIAKVFWNEKEYTSIIQIFSILVSISNSVFTFFFGVLYDKWHSYDPILILVLSFISLELITLIIFFNIKKEET